MVKSTPTLEADQLVGLRWAPTYKLRKEGELLSQRETKKKKGGKNGSVRNARVHHGQRAFPSAFAGRPSGCRWRVLRLPVRLEPLREMSVNRLGEIRASMSAAALLNEPGAQLGKLVDLVTDFIGMCGAGLLEVIGGNEPVDVFSWFETLEGEAAS